MPVQMNEVIIRAVVDNSTSSTTASSAPSVASSSGTTDAEIATLVLEIIKEKNER